MSNRIGPRHLVIAGLLFLLPTMILILLQGDSTYDTERGLTRFLNAFLTSYTIASVFFVVNMFQYSKSRKEPTAPWISMVYAVILSILVTLLLTSQGGFLMEENGSQRAQILYNIIHFIVTSIAILMAAGIMVLISFANLESKEKNES
ncbi:MAG: hypothetical protein CMA41_06555 [Euryarchaeota archaeon]|jgi:uncharacterized membrane protein|nr:hypothetical protein [Euryarchaeota archaeon]MBF13970.1 hypothetical protein [Euryarchaeota archaeon]CAI8341523.1 MAG: Uncharacterised protein [Euryarchaeota archaeon UBA443]|tara:strand:- start:701 stop:1144 length:444 start_codon:yes stop_codon:yes gene_type:complete